MAGTRHREVVPLGILIFLGVFGACGPRCKASQEHSGMYLLVTSEHLADGFAPLVQRRANQGLSVQVVTIESIEADWPGVDTQEKIRNCIIDSYTSRYEFDAPFFVALGGDADIVPVRYCFPNADETPFPTEMYYADIDGGDWDADGDGRYGEPEDIQIATLTSEVYLGRIPVNTAREARDYSHKVQVYEERSSEGFADSMILVAGSAALMHPKLHQIVEERLTGNARPGELADHDPVGAVEGSLLIGRYAERIQPYRQAAPLHRFFSYISSWDQSRCGDYLLTRAHLAERLNAGYHFVWFRGHGNANQGALQTGEVGTKNFSRTEALSLNNGERLSIVFGGAAAQRISTGTRACPSARRSSAILRAGAWSTLGGLVTPEMPSWSPGSNASFFRKASSMWGRPSLATKRGRPSPFSMMRTDTESSRC